MDHSSSTSSSESAAGRVLAAVAAVAVAADLLIAVSAPPPYERAPVRVESASDLRHYLDHVADLPGEPWLLMGDSVLVGSVTADVVPDWDRHRVVDYLVGSVRTHAPQTFHQVAFEGLLPNDLRAIVQELDRADADRSVSVLIELNPRYFSRAYAKQATGARPALAAISRWSRIRDWLSDQMPVLRHRRAFKGEISLDVTPVRGDVDGEPELAKRARILEHYRDLDLSDESTQVAALVETVAMLRASGRRGTFFTTPLNDAFVHDVSTERERGDYIATLSGWIDDADHPDLQLVNLDAPAFTSELFVDHSHLLPDGNRRLALNLLNELGVGLATEPTSTEIVYLEDPDRSLVWRVEQGFGNGAPWQALFHAPGGIAVGVDGRIVIADSRNHCLRELTGRYQTVRTIAGLPGQAGAEDGSTASATMSFPTHVALVGDAIFVVDGRDRARLRRVESGNVTTMEAEWTRIDALRTHASELWLLDAGERILAHDPAAGTTRVVLSAAPSELETFDVSSDGTLFLVDVRNRIWRGEPPELVFRNRGASRVQAFPVGFDDHGFVDVRDIRYVERYGGLLVQDHHASKKPAYQPTETIHLQYLDLDGERVYPWVKPVVAGNAYLSRNAHSDSLVSTFHQGVMALHQETASLVYAETARSRVYRVGDGLWGSARLGHAPANGTNPSTSPPEPFGERLGEETFARFRPDRFLDARAERQTRLGPFVGAFVGSSFTVTSDVSPQYSLSRSVEARLRDRLGYRDRIRYEQLSRTRGGLRFEEMVELLEAHVIQGGRLDVVFLSLHRRPLIEDDEYPVYLDRLRALAAVDDTLVVVLDNGGLGTIYREGLRATEPATKSLLDAARAFGFPVVALSDSLLRDHLAVTPWGSPPYAGNHASPWAIETTAALITERSYPLLRRHLDGRVPAHRRPEAAPIQPVDPTRYLTHAFGIGVIDWTDVELATVDPSAVQRRFDGRTMEVYVDLTRAGLSDDGRDEEVIVSVLHELLIRDHAGATATEAAVTLATFANYDEYGRGTLESAVPRYEGAFDREALETLIESYLTSRR